MAGNGYSNDDDNGNDYNYDGDEESNSMALGQKRLSLVICSYNSKTLMEMEMYTVGQFWNVCKFVKNTVFDDETYV